MGIVISLESTLHNSLPTSTPGFAIFSPLIAELQKDPCSPMFPKVFCSPWACFPLFLFLLIILTSWSSCLFFSP